MEIVGPTVASRVNEGVSLREDEKRLSPRRIMVKKLFLLLRSKLIEMIVLLPTFALVVDDEQAPPYVMVPALVDANV